MALINWNQVWVFGGFTIALEHLKKICPARVNPPLKHSDLLKVLNNNGKVAIIVDCTLDELPVKYSEFAYVRNKGLEIWGLSAGGAIRACELIQLGVKGWGSVYDFLMKQESFDLDEVFRWRENENEDPGETGKPAVISKGQSLINIRLNLKLSDPTNDRNPEEATEAVAQLKKTWIGRRHRETRWVALFGECVFTDYQLQDCEKFFERFKNPNHLLSEEGSGECLQPKKYLFFKNSLWNVLLENHLGASIVNSATRKAFGGISRNTEDFMLRCASHLLWMACEMQLISSETTPVGPSLKQFQQVFNHTPNHLRGEVKTKLLSHLSSVLSSPSPEFSQATEWEKFILIFSNMNPHQGFRGKENFLASICIRCLEAITKSPTFKMPDLAFRKAVVFEHLRLNPVTSHFWMTRFNLEQKDLFEKSGSLFICYMNEIFVRHFVGSAQCLEFDWISFIRSYVNVFFKKTKMRQPQGRPIFMQPNSTGPA